MCVTGHVQHEYTRSGVEWRDKFHRPAVTRSCGLSGRSQNRVNNGQYDAFAADLSGLPPEQLQTFDPSGIPTWHRTCAHEPTRNAWPTR
jgi:hypothetical protein